MLPEAAQVLGALEKANAYARLVQSDVRLVWRVTWLRETAYVLLRVVQSDVCPVRRVDRVCLCWLASSGGF